MGGFWKGLQGRPLLENSDWATCGARSGTAVTWSLPPSGGGEAGQGAVTLSFLLGAVTLWTGLRTQGSWESGVVCGAPEKLTELCEQDPPRSWKRATTCDPTLTGRSGHFFTQEATVCRVCVNILSLFSQISSLGAT